MTFVNVVINVAIDVSAASIAYIKIFQVFKMRMDFCSNWRNQGYISSESVSNAASAMVSSEKKCYSLEFRFYLKPNQ